MYWSTKFSNGAWVVDDYATAKWALTNPHLSAQRANRWLRRCELAGQRPSLRPFKVLFNESVVFLEGAKHQQMRKILITHLRLAMSGNFDARLGTIVDDVITAAIDRRQIDVIKDIAQSIPLLSICDLLGIDIPNKVEFFDWCQALSQFLGSPIESHDSALKAQDAALAMAQFFNMQIAAGNFIHEENKILYSLLRLPEFEGSRARRVLFSQLCTLLFGAYETTHNLIGNTFYLLSAFPNEFTKLKAQPALINGAIDEILRFASPVQYTGRIVIQEMTIDGQPLKPNDLVIVDIASANRDPLAYANPELFSITRPQSPHLAFGFGHHFCLGSQLSLLELRIILQNLIGGAVDLRPLESPMELSNALYKGYAYLPMMLNRKYPNALRASEMMLRHPSL